MVNEKPYGLIPILGGGAIPIQPDVILTQEVQRIVDLYFRDLVGKVAGLHQCSCGQFLVHPDGSTSHVPPDIRSGFVEE